MSDENKDVIRKHYESIGKKGGQTTLKKHGTDHYARISKLAVKARQEKRNKDA